jgi:hypothetical protein
MHRYLQLDSPSVKIFVPHWQNPSTLSCHSCGTFLGLFPLVEQFYDFVMGFTQALYVVRLTMYWIKHLPNHNPCGNCTIKSQNHCSVINPVWLGNTASVMPIVHPSNNVFPHPFLSCLWESNILSYSWLDFDKCLPVILCPPCIILLDKNGLHDFWGS